MRSRFGHRKKGNQDMVLQITSMADIFTILLVFLLKSFSTGASNLTPTDGMVLPEAKVSNPVVDMLKLEITKTSVLLDEKAVSTLNQFQFDPSDLETNGIPKSLAAAFTRQRQKDTLQKTPKMMVLADQGVPYGTLKRVLASAAYSGFEDFKLVVVQNQ